VPCPLLSIGQGEEKEAGAAGGESGARAHGPTLGGEAGPVLSNKDSCKVPPYATTSVGFATTSCESATGTRCSVTQTDYNITRSTLPVSLADSYSKVAPPRYRRITL